MYCVFLGNSVTVESTPYREVALRSMLLRGIFIPSIGWSLAWKSNIWNLFHQGSNAFQFLRMFLTPPHTPRNLFGLTDGSPFQIDTNFGATSAICEILLESQNNQVEVLPALPVDNWLQGSVCGLRASGNYQVNIRWINEKLDKADTIPLSNNKNCRIIQQNKKLILENLLCGFIYHINSLLQFTHQSTNI